MELPESLIGGYHRGVAGGQLGLEKQVDHFVVEDLLDFTNEDEDEEEAFIGSDVYETIAGNSADSSSVSVITAVDSCNSSFSGPDASFPSEFRFSGDLSEPAYDELAELEWITNLGEETFSSEDIEKLHLISGVKSSSGAVSAPSSTTGTPARGRMRSKRSRAANVSWSSRLPILPSSSSELEPIAVAAPPRQPKPVKKKDPATATVKRKCLHCESEETPQWRAGPMGPKTLCNACGVRYKSGRLVPEYRPAASPTFVVSEHSNSHRKVLQLRRQKDQEQQLRRGPEEVVNGGVGGDEFLIHDHIGIDFRQLI
ncbi:putative transcription factor C2C2-GATA family [Dioscorea sansibarensis]